MDDDPRQRFADYARQLADLMGLKDWRVYVEQDPPADPRLAASAECVYGLKTVNLRLSQQFLRDDPEGQRETICHELVHAHLAFMNHLLLRTLDDALVEPYRVAMEYGVDGIAEALAPHLPLPSAVRPRPVSSRRKKAR